MAWCVFPFVLLLPLRVLVFGLKTAFPPRKDVGTRVGARRTPEGAKRSAAVEAKRRLVQAGSRGTIGPERGNY